MNIGKIIEIGRRPFPRERFVDSLKKADRLLEEVKKPISHREDEQKQNGQPSNNRRRQRLQA